MKEEQLDEDEYEASHSPEMILDERSPELERDYDSSDRSDLHRASPSTFS